MCLSKVILFRKIDLDLQIFHLLACFNNNILTNLLVLKTHDFMISKLMTDLDMLTSSCMDVIVSLNFKI